MLLLEDARRELHEAVLGRMALETYRQQVLELRSEVTALRAQMGSGEQSCALQAQSDAHRAAAFCLELQQSNARLRSVAAEK